MKSLRMSALLVLGTLSICILPVQAQQEVDHFDQPIAASTHVRSGKTQSHDRAKATQRRRYKEIADASSHKQHTRQTARQISSGKDAPGK